MAYLDEDDARQGNPAFVLVFGVIAAIALPLAAGRGLVGASFADAASAGKLAGGMFANVLIICIGVYFLGLRRCPRAWCKPALAIVGTVAAFFTLVGVGAANYAVQQDLVRSLSQTRTVLGGDRSNLEPGTDAGPLTRMNAASLNAILAQSRAFDADAEAAGLKQILMLDIPGRGSPVLKHCDAFRALGDEARTDSRMIDRAFGPGVAIGRAAEEKGELPAGTTNDWIRGSKMTEPLAVRKWTLSADIADHARSVCATLSSRPWLRQDARVMFVHAADSIAVNRSLQQVQADFAEINAIDARSAKDLSGAIQSAQARMTRMSQ
ncbi:hypothetical protein HZF05_15235 [Sphingomonas sp. CGMCC 1.13654]|uniref:Uncharacterized protein n=1 Tax=Sphingomonas chungangi TaxID=2683589 RepID=A0A838LA35_9SPHN|nr:hypothetical protein [Sphingomonas chungangi]MBA2935439.1 hypothetical protein [Sphingomonas chungangi]MVW56946.1 hypothetical protein [Sphingomonas chungangi]